MLWCRKCHGRVFVDRTFTENQKFELTCSRCGKRWFVDKETNAFGRFLVRSERELRHLLGL